MIQLDIDLKTHHSAIPQLWMVLHDVQLGESWRPNLPEVFVIEDEPWKFTEAWQRLVFAMNPSLTPHQFTTLFGWTTAFCNGTGFGEPGEPRANHITGENLDASDPNFDKARFCGGTSFTGVETAYGDVWIETLSPDSPPTLEWIVQHPWMMFDAVSTGNGIPRPFPENNGIPIKIPLVASNPVLVPFRKYDKDKNLIMGLKKLPLGYTIPSPYVV